MKLSLDEAVCDISGAEGAVKGEGVKVGEGQM